MIITDLEYYEIGSVTNQIEEVAGGMTAIVIFAGNALAIGTNTAATGTFDGLAQEGNSQNGNQSAAGFSFTSTIVATAGEIVFA
jgi:hypothetical protein